MSSSFPYLTKGKTIIAVGRNYVEHAKELGNQVPTKPFFFLKPWSSIVTPPRPIVRPKGCQKLHYEVELCVILKKSGKNIPSISALSHVAGFSIGLDMTARDWQDQAKLNGLPWAFSKGFDMSFGLGDFVPIERVPDPHNLAIWLQVDGVIRQKGNTNQMIFQIPQLIQEISQVMTLNEGDIILTGTPSGVGDIQPGSKITAGIELLGQVEFDIKQG